MKFMKSTYFGYVISKKNFALNSSKRFNQIQILTKKKIYNIQY